MSHSKHQKSNARHPRNRLRDHPHNPPQKSKIKIKGMRGLSSRVNISRNLLTGLAILLLVVIGVGWYVGNSENKTATNIVQSLPMPTKAPIMPIIDITPKSVLQGEPIMISVLGVDSTADIKSVSVVNSSLPLTMYQNVPTTFYGVGINQKIGTTTVVVTLKNRNHTSPTRLSATFVIKLRQRYDEPLPVPDQIGGNSVANQAHISNVLDVENAEIAAVPMSKAGAFWDEGFVFPLKTATGTSDNISPKITDPYGFNRDTGELTIPHKGVDFKAASGTPVYAINQGVVRLTKTFVVYGNTVIVDHGIGIESLYMHLSRMAVTSGEVVKRGQLIGYSGETGYAVGPHLHLSLKIGGVSIDPMKFFALFGAR